MKFQFAVFLLLTLGISVSGQARMYQWVNPNTNKTQLSGMPPAWYRSESGGPRVRVFESGNLIDDTSIALPDSQRDDLREAAFSELQQRQQAEALRKLELVARRKELREKEDKIRAQREASEEAAREEKEQEEKDKAESENIETVDAGVIERLKSLIGQFDRQTIGGTKTP